MNENPCKHGTSPAEFCDICNKVKKSMSISCSHGAIPPCQCPLCGYTHIHVDRSEIEQFREKANKDAIDSHNQKQEILSLQRIVARQNKLIGELYQQVHGRPMKETKTGIEGFHEYFGGRVEPLPLDTPDKPNRFNAFRTASGLELGVYEIHRSTKNALKVPFTPYHHIQDEPTVSQLCFVCGGHPPKGEYEYCVTCDDTGYINV